MAYGFFLTISRVMAYLGGLMLSLLVILTCLSVVGRELNDIMHTLIDRDVMPGFAAWALDLGVGPINGDFELIEAGVAFAIFAFLPLCQITGGHATVDIFTAQMSPRVNRILLMITDVVFGLVLVLIAVQLSAGMQSKIRSGETSFLIEFPIWWAYALSLTGAVVAAVVGVYLGLVRIWEAMTGLSMLHDGMESEN